MDAPHNPSRSCLKSIFVSPAEPRLRAGWRLLLQTILLGVLFSCFLLPLAFVPSASQNNTWLLLYQIAEFFAITLSVFVARRFLDRRSFVSLGFSRKARALRDLGAGILITFFMMGSIFLIEWAAGWLTFDGFAWQFDSFGTVIRGTLVMFAAFVLVGWNEELLSRGYHLQTLESGLNTFWAVLLSSAVFGVQHLINPNSESVWFVTVGIFLAGVFLAYGYLRTRQLWLSIGLHIGWNFFEGVVFGFPVSGLDSYALMHIRISGPVLWTGGAFGPEAGLVLIPGIALGMFLIWLYTRREPRVDSRESTESNGQDALLP